MSATVTFRGVRGSTPCSRPGVQRYGGNTSCVTIEAPDQDTIVLDLGTGLQPWVSTISPQRGLTIHALVSHLHWDHIQGLPFFAPYLAEDTTLNIYGCTETSELIAQAFSRFVSPPFFPITVEDLPATVRFIDFCDSSIDIGRAVVLSRSVRHVGPTFGYRIEIDGVAIAYIPDHQEPFGNSNHVDEGVLELADSVDLLIHDAQLWRSELVGKKRWGHSTPEYALEVAIQSGAKSLALFHHDPGHDDDEIDEMLAKIKALAGETGSVDVFAARQGASLELSSTAGLLV